MWQGVKVIAKPEREIVTIDVLRERLRIDVEESDNQLLGFLRGAVARIDGPTGIGFAMLRQTWRKSLDSFPQTILLPGAPIKEVVSISYVDTEGNEQTIDEADYRVALDAEPVRVEPAFGVSWPATRHVIAAVKVDYRLGEDDPADVPADLIDAVCMLVGHRYENREAVKWAARSPNTRSGSNTSCASTTARMWRPDPMGEGGPS